MAWTGTGVYEQISDNCVRVSGLSLAAGAAGVMTLYGGGGAEVLPEAFQPTPYGDVSLIEGVWVTYEFATTAVNGDQLRIVKTGALTLTFTNDDAGNATPSLILYIHFH